MSATQQSVQPASVNRRRCVRQKAHAPAYATFPGARKSQMLDLHEVLDISLMGVALQVPSGMEPDQQVDLCLDLAEASGQILTTAKVIWSNPSGRVGLAFAPLPKEDVHRLQQWLFLNAMAGAANAASCAELPSLAPQTPGLRPSFTDTLTAVSAVQREAESLGPDLEAVLTLIVCRSRSLLEGAGAAIALAANKPGSIVCRASVGLSAPPVGAELKAGVGFSGDCLRSGQTLRCDDCDTDARVDPQTCRALGIRSMIASPIRAGEKVIGLIEVFSEQPNAFAEKDGVVLQRLAESIAAAVNRPTSGNDVPPPPTVKSFAPPGSVLFGQLPKERPEPKETKTETSVDADKVGGIRLPRTHLYLLIFVAATVALALGFILAPWIQEELRAEEGSSPTQTVLASSRPAAGPSEPALPTPTADTANFDQLLQLAQQGNASAENALGLLYAQGDDKHSIEQDESEAANWFTKAAEHGSSAAQYKLGLLYWGGHGVPKDINKAYFWAVLARAGGQEGSQDLAKVLANGMTRPQAIAIEQQAEIWYQQHQIQPKPAAGH